MNKILIVSGYFNPIHIGHIQMLKSANKLGDKLIVIVNNDIQQQLKKGKIIMNEHERLEIVRSLKYVDEAILSIDEDLSISKTLESVAKNYYNCEVIFGNGGDRKSPTLIPEAPICQKFGIKMVFGVGGNNKPNSSTRINKLLGLE